jgi:acylphosphatase
VVVSGRVQGVWFRDSARAQAEAHGVTGLAANRPDGRVELDLEGEAAAVEAVIAWARRGPSRARVDHVDVRDDVPVGYTNFRTR